MRSAAAAAAAGIIWSVTADRFIPPALLKVHLTLSTQAICSQLRSVRHASQPGGPEQNPERHISLPPDPAGDPPLWQPQELLQRAEGSTHRRRALILVSALVSSQPPGTCSLTAPQGQRGPRHGCPRSCPGARARRRCPARPAWGVARVPAGSAGAGGAALRSPHERRGSGPGQGRAGEKPRQGGSTGAAQGRAPPRKPGPGAARRGAGRGAAGGPSWLRAGRRRGGSCRNPISLRGRRDVVVAWRAEHVGEEAAGGPGAPGGGRRV